MAAPGRKAVASERTALGRLGCGATSTVHYLIKILPGGIQLGFGRFGLGPLVGFLSYTPPLVGVKA
jgi:hypothetical protein